MDQITGPIIAITLVLLSVFVPVAFIPGISGQLFRQFAVTISIAMLISAVERADPVAGALRHLPAPEAPTRGADGAGAARHRLARATATPRVVRRLVRVARLSSCWSLLWRAAASSASRASRRPASCRRRTRARSSSTSSCPTAPRWRAPARRRARSRSLLKTHAAGAGHLRRHRLFAARRGQRVQRAASWWRSSSPSRIAAARPTRRRR